MGVAWLLEKQGTWWHQVFREAGGSATRAFFWPLAVGVQRASLAGPLLLDTTGVQRPPLPHLTPSLGSFSIAWHSICLKGPSGWGPSLLLFRPSGIQRPLSLRSFSILLEKQNTAVGTYVVRERGHSDGSNPCMWFSSITLPPWLPGFLSRVFPALISLTPTWAIYLQLTAVLAPGLLLNPYTAAPSHCASQRTCVPLWGT